MSRTSYPPLGAKGPVRAVRVQLLGPVGAWVDGRPSPLRNHSDLLLARLLVDARPLPREQLAEWLWPAAPREARLHSLREALRRLRGALAEQLSGQPLLLVDRELVHLAPNPELSCDWLELQAELRAVHAHDHRRPEACAPCLDRLRRVVAAAAPGFAAGEVAELNPAVAEWVEAQRDHLRTEVAWAWGALADAAAERGDHAEVVAASEAQLARDPWDEAAHRRVLRALAAAGQTARAAQWYEALAERLQRELGVAPDDATEELYQRILHGEAADGEAAAALVEPASVTDTANAFVGREADLEWFESALQRPDARWFTITGAGGMGKSRLAREIGRRAGPSFRYGAAFVPLAHVLDPARVPTEVARALQLSVTGVGDPAKHVGDWLRSREVLLIIDNLEQLPEGADLVAGWLEAAPQLRVIATSRERLGLACEHLWPLAGLPVGEDSAAVRLWVARTRQLDPHRELDADELRGAERIARLVDGHPLALELTAEAGADRSSLEVAAELERDLSWLQTSRRDAAAHQRTLLQVLSTTWARLDAPLAEAALAVSVFAAAFDVEAAHGVAGVGLPTLRALADRSLLTAVGPRYVMHPLIRRFADEQGDRRARAARHADWHLALAERHSASLVLRQDTAARDALAPSWDELRAAITFLCTTSRAAHVVRLALHTYQLAVWMGWDAHGLAMLDALPLDALEAEEGLGRLLFARAHLAWRCRGAASAVQRADEALRWAERHGDERCWVETASLRGAIARNVGLMAEGEHWLALAAERSAGVSDDRVAGLAIYQLALVRYEQEQGAEARALLDRAITRLSAAGARHTAVHASSVRGLVRVRAGDAGGLEDLRDAAREFLTRGWPGAADPALALAFGLAELSRWAEAARAARSAESACQRMSFRPGLHTARFVQVVAAVGRRDRREALQLATSLVDHALQLGGSRASFETLVAVAVLHATGDRPHRALPLATLLRGVSPTPSSDARRFLDRFVPSTPEGPETSPDALASRLLQEHAALAS